MINILRTNQVRAAQKGIPTGLVYQQNEKTLNKIGSPELEQMLRNRDWAPLNDVKVNRRDFEALRAAQDLQEGDVEASEYNLSADTTAAANKGLDKESAKDADMIKVILQALDKRIESGEALSGPETGVTLMATDFLIRELEAAIGF